MGSLSDTKNSLGLVFDGIAGSAAVDSSGEVLSIEGADISDLEDGKAPFNWEHIAAGEGHISPGEELVGRVLFAKKIFKESDCDNSRERLYWKQLKGIPFIYVIGRLFDAAGHRGAQALAAQMRDALAHGDRMILGMSVEGSTLLKEGNVLKQSCIRKIAITAKACNKTAVLQVVSDSEAPAGFAKKPSSTTADILEGLGKQEHPLYRKLGGVTETEYSPIDEVDHTELLKSIIRIKVMQKALAKTMSGPGATELPLEQLLVDRNAMMSAHDNVSRGRVSQTAGPLSVWRTDAGHLLTDGHHRLVQHLLSGHHGGTVPVQVVGEGDTDHTAPQPLKLNGAAKYGGLESIADESLLARDAKYGAPMKKALTAGGGDVAPSQLTGGAALQREDVIRFKAKAMKTLKSFLDKNDDFSRDQAREAFKAELPEASDGFIDHFADIAEDYKLKIRKGLEDDYPKLNPEIGAGIGGAATRVDRASEASAQGAVEPKKKGSIEMKPGGKMLIARPGAGKGSSRVALQQHFPDDEAYHALLKPDQALASGRIDPETYQNIVKTVHEPWHRAMSHWLPLNKALSQGKVPKGVMAKAVIFAAMSPNCLDDKTEALTQRGWVPGFELKPDDILLTKNPRTAALEWQGLLDLRLFPDYEGELIEIDSRSFKVVTTPEHRWLVTTQRGRVLEKTSETLTHAEQIHRTGQYQAPVSSSLTADEAELLGWFVTDGFIRRPSPSSTFKKLRVFIVQSPSGNPEKCERIQALLERLAPGEFGRYQYDDQKCNWYVGRRLTEKLAALCPDRTLRVDTLLGLNAVALARLQEAMLLGDGSSQERNGWAPKQVLATGRADQAGAFQALLIMNGNASNAVLRDMSGYEPKSEKLKNVPKMSSCWYVSKSERQHYLVDKSHIKRFHGKVPVWCPVVANTFFVARRLGQVFVTGNTSVPLQERYYGHYMDMLHSGKVDPFKPISEDAVKEFTERSTNGSHPEWNRGYYAAHPLKINEDGTPDNEGHEDADVGDLPQIMGLRNAHKLFPYLEHLTAKHRDDTQGIAGELMDMKAEHNAWDSNARRRAKLGQDPSSPPVEHQHAKGYGPKLTRYLLGMMGGGNMIVPDRHMVRSTFDMSLEPIPGKEGKFQGSPMLNKLQTGVVTKAANEPLLRAIDHNFFVKHPAVKHVLETFPKHFAGREQQAIFPAFWLHWLTIGHHDQMRGRPFQGFNSDTDHGVFWDSVKDEMIKHGLHPHPLHDKRPQMLPEDDDFDFGANLTKAEGGIDPWPRHPNHLDHPVWLKAAGVVQALRQRWGETPAMLAYFSHVLPKVMAAETPVPPVQNAPHPAYQPQLAKAQGLMIDLRKALGADGQEEHPSLDAVAPQIHHVYRFQPGPDLKVRRHPAGRFMTAGNSVNILEDYHGHLRGALTEGPLDQWKQQQISNLSTNHKFEVVPLSDIRAGKRPELWEHPQVQAPTAPASSFEYIRHGQDKADHLEYIGGKPHLNGHPLDQSQAQALIQHVRNGHAVVRYKASRGSTIQKMEDLFERLMKADPAAAEQIHAALGKLDELVQQGHLDPQHAEALRNHAFKDPMTGHVMGNKFAYADFLNRSEGKGGVHVALDGNDFKSVNDRYGHETGDRAIKSLGTALRGAMDEVAPGQGKLFRTGGDEFAAHLPTHEHAAAFGRALRNRLEAQVPLEGQHRLSMSLGFGTDPGSADRALYHAKSQKLHPQTGQSLYEKGAAPNMAHSLVPGFEGPVPLDHTQLHVKPPPAPMPLEPAPAQPVVHTPPATGSPQPQPSVAGPAGNQHTAA